MCKKLLAISALAALWLAAAGFASAADQARTPQGGQPAQKEFIYGSQLMSEQERAEHRSRMLSAKSAEEQEQIRREHHEQMKLRAEARGMTLPEEPPARGARRGSCGQGEHPCAGMPFPEQRAATDAAKEKAGIAYVSGGIGDDDPVARMAEDYNLHMIFATKGSGEYLADIKVVIEDSKVRRVLEVDSPGPIFYVKLPTGSYRITATYNGTSLRKSVMATDRRLRDLYFYWPRDEVSADRGRS